MSFPFFWGIFFNTMLNQNKINCLNAIIAVVKQRFSMRFYIYVIYVPLCIVNALKLKVVNGPLLLTKF